MRLLAVSVLCCTVASAAAAATSKPLRLPQAPYVGLACHVPAPGCDRVGVAVWLADRARAVTAFVHGHTITLDTGPGRGSYARGLFWQGFFHDRDIATLASRPGVIAVDIRATFTSGRAIAATATAPVSAGYG